MTTPQSFGSAQKLQQYLGMLLGNVPALVQVLEDVALEAPRPRFQAYITRPDLEWDPGAVEYMVGAKVTYLAKDGLKGQFGVSARIGSLQSQTLLERTIYVLGLQLAQSIRAHEEAKKPIPPLPIRALTAQDREEMCLPF